MDSAPATSPTCPSCGSPLPDRPSADAVRCRVCGAPLGSPPGALPEDADEEADARLQPGTLLAGGRYRIERRLGKGGFGEAYLAHNTQIQGPCVVKRLTRPPRCSRARWQRLRANFRREAEALVQLNTPGHPNIPEVYDYLDRLPCLVMKYIEGRSLADVLRERGQPLPEAEALRYARDVCSALAYMHSRAPQPVLHRDIKPANILLDATGRIWLIDFGLARSLPESPADTGAAETTASGTPGYTPVEQWRGAAVPRSDVYALGVTLRELLTLPGGAAAVRPEIEALLGRATAPDSGRRPSAEELGAALDAILNRPPIPAAFTPDRPPEVAAFIGREGEIAVLTDRLTRAHAAVITGLAGVGKTSLAVVLSRTISTPEHTFWHTFHPGEKADRLLRSLAAYLAGHGQMGLVRSLTRPALSGEPLSFEQLVSYVIDLLRGRQHLVCLDDTHVVDDDDQARLLLRRLSALAQAGEILLVATSRRAVRWHDGEGITLHGLSDADARDLLSSRGVALPAELIDQILDRTEGNAKLLHLTANLLRRAHDPRHLIAALAEADDIASYLVHQVHAGLGERERAVMSAVAVLQGYGGTRAVVEHLLEGDCWEALNVLRERYLLVATPAAAGMSYVQHALVQSFYYRRLSREERRRLHRRAAAYFADEQPDVTAAARHFLAADEHDQAARLLTGHVDSIVDDGEAAELYRLLGSLRRERVGRELWPLVCEAAGVAATVLGDLDAARTNLTEAVHTADADTPGEAELPAQARRLRLLSLVYERAGAYDLAVAVCDEGLGLARRLPQPHPELAGLYARRGAALCRLSRFDAAEESCAAGLEALPPGRSSHRERMLLWQVLARIDIERGRYRQALDMLQQGLALAQELGDRRLIASAQSDLGLALHHLGEEGDAERCYAASLQIRSDLGDETGRIEALNGLGLVQWARGDHPAALDRFSESAALCARLGIPGHRAAALLNLGQLLLELSRPAEAQRHLRESGAIYAGLGNTLKLAHARYLLGDVALLRGEPAEALDEGRLVLEMARRLGSLSLESCALRVSGEALLSLGRSGDADRALADAWRIQGTVGDPYDQALILAAWAEAAHAMHRRGVARWRARRALALAREQHMPLLVRRIETLLAALPGGRGGPASPAAHTDG